MLSDLSKSAFKIASEDRQKNIDKKYKKHEIVQLLKRWSQNMRKLDLKFLYVFFW